MSPVNSLENQVPNTASARTVINSFVSMTTFQVLALCFRGFRKRYGGDGYIVDKPAFAGAVAVALQAESDIKFFRTRRQVYGDGKALERFVCS